MICAYCASVPTFRLLPLYLLLTLLTMDSDEDFEPGTDAPNPPPTQQHVYGSSTATINDLAGDMSNTNVDGTVGPNFFVARLRDEATTLALYGYLKSASCILGLQGKVQLPGEVNCALRFLELFRKNNGNRNQSAASFGKLSIHNVSKDKPDGYTSDWNWDKGFTITFDKSVANAELSANDRSLVHWSGLPSKISIFIKKDDRAGVTDRI